MEPPKKRQRRLSIQLEPSLEMPVKQNSLLLEQPDDMIRTIFCFLKASTVILAKTTCQQLYHANLPINYSDLGERNCSIESFVHWAPSVEKIYLYNRGVAKGFFSFIGLFENLHQLHLRRCLVENNFFDLYQLRLLPKLYSLGLWKSNITAGDFKHIKHLRELRYLDFTDTSITDECLTAILENLPHLLQICLTNCDSITAVAFDIKNTSKLQKICLPFSSVEQMKMFNSYKNRYPDLNTLGMCDVDHSNGQHVFNLVDIHHGRGVDFLR